MSSTNNENSDFIRRTPLNRGNSSLMDVIGIGTRNSNNSSSNLANFSAVTDPATVTTPNEPGYNMGIPRVDSPFQRVDSPFQRTDSPFQTDYGMNPLQRTTSIFNETNGNIVNPATPTAPMTQINNSTTTTPIANPTAQGMPGFIPGVPVVPPPGMMGLYISQWKYIDHQGDQQGPFTTDLMSQWYHSNYFQPSLQICIVNNNDNSTTVTTTATTVPPIDPLQLQNKFFTLNDLIMKVGNAIDPFATYDSIVNTFLRGPVNPAAAQMVPPPMGLPNNMMNSLPSTSTTRVPSIIENIQPSQEVKSPTKSGGSGNDPAAPANSEIRKIELEGVVANIHSGDYTFDEILDLSLEDNAYYHQVLVPVPMQRKLKKKIEFNTVIQPTTDPRFDNIWAIAEIARGNPKPYLPVEIPVPVSEPSTEIVQEQLNELGITNVNEEAISETVKEPVETKEKKSSKKEKKTKVEEQIKTPEQIAEEKRKIKAELMAQKLIEEEEAKIKHQEAKEARVQRKAKKQKEKKAKKSKHELASKSEDVESKSEASEGDDSIKINSNSAPWATKSKSKGKAIPLTSFFELQRNEELKQQKLEEQKQLDAMKLSEQILKEEQAKEKNKSMLTWAKSGIANDVIPTVDIKAQLLKDQGQKKKARKQSLQESQMKVSNDVPTDPSFIEEQQRIWEQLQKGTKGQKSNGASVVKSNTTAVSSSTTNAWTTVSTKAKKVTTTATATKPQLVNKQAKQIGSSTSIPALKNKFVSNIGTISPAAVNTRTATPMYPGNSSISKRQEFLKWCKAQLRLNPGISHKSVLEVLLSLPAGPETNEIIADTIYSNSSVMDGRRFAVEFNKKRVECEKQVTDPLSWSEALALPEGNDDDWEFQVVSKKKKGKKF